MKEWMTYTEIMYTKHYGYPSNSQVMLLVIVDE